MEPDVCVDNQPLDAILDLGSSISYIDRETTDDLHLKLLSHECDIPQLVSVDGTKLTSSVPNVIGWVEIELGVYGIGCLPTRFLVTKSMFSKEVPIVLGSHQIKKILAQGNVAR